MWINFDVLEQLDPSIRANIDLDYLALLTNTDPALMEKYKVQRSPGNKDGDSTYHSWASSLHINSLFSPAKISLQVCPCKLLATIKFHSSKVCNFESITLCLSWARPIYPIHLSKSCNALQGHSQRGAKGANAPLFFQKIRKCASCCLLTSYQAKAVLKFLIL